MTSQSLKVCQLCAVDFTLQKFLLPLIDGMRSRGWSVKAVCSDGPFVLDLRQRGYEIDAIPIARSMNPAKAIYSIYALIKYFKREHFDVVHAHTPVAALVGRIAAKLAGVPLVIYTAHGFYFHDNMPWWKYRFFVFLEKFGGYFTDLLFTQSAEDADAAVSENILPKSQVMVIGNGVDVERFSLENAGSGEKIRTELGIPQESFVVGFIGRQVREKGLVEFLEAAAGLADRFPQLWILLVGERLASDHAGGLEKELAVARNTFGARLVSTGLREDIPQLLLTMDLFCLPSWREGMPRSIIEAMMLAKPVLATDIRGSREEVIAEETGLIVAPQSPEALAGAMERFLLNPEWGTRLGESGRKRALKIYDERRVVAMQIDRIDQEMLGLESR